MHRLEKTAENSSRRTRFFYGARSPSCCLFPCRSLTLFGYWMRHIRDGGGSAALSCPILPVYLIRAVFSLADVVELPTMHVEFNLFLPLAVLFQSVRQGVYSLRHNCLLPFFHAAHTL